MHEKPQFHGQLKFLSGPELRSELVDMISSSKSADFAVAYWGKTAQETLQLKPGSRVICDLMSGGCNPAEIKRLREAGVKVRGMDKLHAKVYLTKDSVIIGSANASTNGLGEEARENSGTIEAALLTKEPETISEVANWFKQQWQKAYEIDEQHLAEAEIAFKRHRRFRPLRATESLLTRLRDNPSWFSDRPIRVCVWNDEADEWAERLNATERQRRNAKIGNLSLKASDNEQSYYYQDNLGWGITPGEIIIDYWVSLSENKFEYQGIFQVPHENPYVRRGKGRWPRIVLLDELKELPGTKFNKLEQQKLGNALLSYIKEAGTEPNKHLFYIDQPLDEVAELLKTKI